MAFRNLFERKPTPPAPVPTPDEELEDGLKNNRLEKIKSGIERGADINQVLNIWWVNGHKVTPLIYATYNEQIDILNLLLNAKANIYKKTNRQNAFISSLKVGNLEIIDCFLNAGAKLELSKNDQHAAIGFLMRQKWQEKTVIFNCYKKLLNANLDIHEIVYYQYSPYSLLKRAIEEEHIPMINDLIARKANIYDDCFGMAIETQNMQIIEPFLKVADLNKKCNNQRKLPLELAITQKNTTLIKYLALLGADVNKKIKSSDTLLMHALSRSLNDTTINFLIDKADLSISNNTGDTALHDAIKLERHNVVLYMLKYASAKLLSKVNNTGETPLFTAVKSGHIDIVRALLAAGAPDLPNQQGTAEIIARNDIRVLIAEAREAKQLPAALSALKAAQEAKLTMPYSSETEAKKAYAELSHVTMQTIEHNIDLLTQNLDQLTIDYKKDVPHLLTRLSTFLTVINQEDRLTAKQDLDELAAHCRAVAAKLGHAEAKRITEYDLVRTNRIPVTAATTTTAFSFSPTLFANNDAKNDQQNASNAVVTEQNLKTSTAMTN